MLPKHPDQLNNDELDGWIRRLVDAGEPEGIRLDYKEQLNLGTPSKRRELAKDIASFANELGGTLIYGVPEERSNPQAAPIPRRPYGIDLIPVIEQDLENIYSSTLTPLLPECRIRRINLSEFQGKVCYIVWTPESWAGPHMVHGYGDGRFYRRGQFRAVIMSERDVEERYRRRLFMLSAAEEFIKSEDALHLESLFGHNQAKTALMIVPLLWMPNRVAFNEPPVQQWLRQHTMWRDWSPSMRGVRTFITHSTEERNEVEVHRHGALVLWRYTLVSAIHEPPVIGYHREFQDWLEILKFAGRFFQFIGYVGPLVVSLTILCPEGYALFLPRPNSNETISLEPSGTHIRIRIEPSASELVTQPEVVLKQIGDEVFRAFGLWQADCFTVEGRFIR